MDYSDYSCLKVEVDRGVAFVTIDNPPINLLDALLIGDLGRVRGDVEKDEDVSVVVFQSANPDFFIAHADANMLLLAPDTVGPRPTELSPGQVGRERWRYMPKVSIAKIEGRCGGGGSEFALALDMRFAALGRAIFCQMEAAVGLLAFGGGSHRLSRLIGRSRAMEVLLSAGDYPADLAAQYGWINRALPASELGPFVDGLAYRIASFPPMGIALNKAAVNASLDLPTKDALIEEAYLGRVALAQPSTKARMKLALERGAQTREAELDFVGRYPEYAEVDPPRGRNVVLPSSW